MTKLSFPLGAGSSVPGWVLPSVESRIHAVQGNFLCLLDSRGLIFLLKLKLPFVQVGGGVCRRLVNPSSRESGGDGGEDGDPFKGFERGCFSPYPTSAAYLPGIV